MFILRYLLWENWGNIVDSILEEDNGIKEYITSARLKYQKNISRGN